MAILLALLTMIAAVVVGIWLFTADHLIIGLAVFLGAIPIAIAMWAYVNDRRGY
jgi:hypothetical protein